MRYHHSQGNKWGARIQNSLVLESWLLRHALRHHYMLIKAVFIISLSDYYEIKHFSY